jgi:hypothetical protein
MYRWTSRGRSPSSLELGPRRDYFFVVVAPVLVMSSPKQTTAALMPFFCHAKYLSYTNDFQWDKKPRHFYTFGLCSCNLLTEANNLVLGPSLTYSVSELQESLLLELIPKKIIWSYDLYKIVFWSQDISIQMWWKVVNPFSKTTVPPHAMEVLGGTGDIAPNHSRLRHWWGGEWSASRPGRGLPPRTGPPPLVIQVAGWSPEQVWTKRLEEKFFRLCRGSNLYRPVVQPVARHYTDWSTPTHRLKYTKP